MRTLKHRDGKGRAHGHTACRVKGQSLESNWSLWTLTPAEPHLGSVLKKKKKKKKKAAICPRMLLLPDAIWIV